MMSNEKGMQLRVKLHPFLYAVFFAASPPSPLYGESGSRVVIPYSPNLIQMGKVYKTKPTF